MKEENIDIWKNKLDWIVSKEGMEFFNSCPNYMIFNKKKNAFEE